MVLTCVLIIQKEVTNSVNTTPEANSQIEQVPLRGRPRMLSSYMNQQQLDILGYLSIYLTQFNSTKSLTKYYWSMQKSFASPEIWKQTKIMLDLHLGAKSNLSVTSVTNRIRYFQRLLISKPLVSHRCLVTLRQK